MLNLTTPIPGGGGSNGSGYQPVSILLWVVILLPIPTIILGLLGNIVALWIFCFKLKAWNINNLLLFNLVIADFLVLMSLPLRIDGFLRGHWVFGDGLCRIDLFLMFSNRSASIALMTVLAIYRYFKVVHPHHWFSHMTKRQAAYMLVFVWLLVISLWVPILTNNHTEVTESNSTRCLYFTCSSHLALITMHRILTVLEFIIPMAMLLFCTIRISSFLRERQMGKPEKVRKAMRVCTAIVVVFMVCFFPNTLTTIGWWVIHSYHMENCATFKILTKLTFVALGLNFLNSALDPIVYVFSSSMFRKALCSSLPHFLRCGQDTGDAEKTASSTESQSTTQQQL